MLHLVLLVHQLSLYDTWHVAQHQPLLQHEHAVQQQQHTNNNTPPSSSSSGPTAAYSRDACGQFHRQWRPPLLASGVLELMTSLQRQVGTWQQDSMLVLQERHEKLVRKISKRCKNIHARLCTPSVHACHEHPLTPQTPWDAYPSVFPEGEPNEADYAGRPCFCDVCQRPIFYGHTMYHCSQGCHFDACKACHDGMM